MLILSDTHINNIEYEYHSGTSYSLYPIRDVHSPKEIQEVKRRIRQDMPNAKIHIRWKLDGDVSSNPMKIPDNAVIKNLQKILGQNESYIQELEEKIKEFSSPASKELNKQNKKELMKDIMIKQYTDKIKDLNRKLDMARKDNSELITLNWQLKQKTP
jgi:predicted RNase H-like nuclease (RuvC/YqgF family)